MTTKTLIPEDLIGKLVKDISPNSLSKYGVIISVIHELHSGKIGLNAIWCETALGAIAESEKELYFHAWVKLWPDRDFLLCER